MQKILEQYKDHAFNILFLAKKKGQVNAAGESILTPAQHRGYAYYRAAIHTLQALIDAPTPAWVGVKFSKKSY
jgi:hypothetical protein